MALNGCKCLDPYLIQLTFSDIITGDERCVVAIEKRLPCGDDDVTQEDCITDGCCYDYHAVGQK